MHLSCLLFSSANESLLSARLSIRLLKDGAGVFRVSKQVFMQGTHFQLMVGAW